MKAAPEPIVLSINDAAKVLAVSAETVRRLVQRGELPHARIGESIRIPRASIEEYLQSRTTTTWRPESGRGRKGAV